MRLGDILERVASLEDFSPEVESYREEVTDTVNEVYTTLFTSAPFTFSQKLAELRQAVDIDGCEAIITPAAAGVPPTLFMPALGITVPGFLQEPERYEGAILIVSGSAYEANNTRFIITKVDDTGLYCAHLPIGGAGHQPVRGWQGVPGVPEIVDIVIRNLFLALPYDCSTPLAVTRVREGQEADLTAVEYRSWADWHRWDELGEPDSWSVAKGIYEEVFQLVQNPYPPVVATAVALLADAWPQGTYRFYTAHQLCNRIGPLSNHTELTIAGALLEPVFTLPDTTVTNKHGIRHRIYVQGYGDAAGNLGERVSHDLGAYETGVADISCDGFDWFILDDVGGAAIAYPAQLPNTAEYFFRLPRPPHSTNYDSIWVYPHTAEESLYRIRYIFIPAPLIEDGDSLNCPPDVAKYILFQTCADLLAKHSRTEASLLWERKATAQLTQVRSKYLSRHLGSTPRKGDWGCGAGSMIYSGQRRVNIRHV